MIKSGASEACAACKYQRRKCKNNCPLARYFPANDPDKFLKVHRLYGIHYLMNILNQVEDHVKNDAMESIIFESEMRKRFPVEGCFGVTGDLVSQFQQASEELRVLHEQISIFRTRA